MVSRDVVIDDKYILNVGSSEVDRQVEAHANKISIQVELDETSKPGREDDASASSQVKSSSIIDRERQPTSLAIGKEKRTCKQPVRYCFEDMVAFALVSGCEYTSCYDDAVRSHDNE